MTAGVYAIVMTGTRYAYVGESANIRARWRDHATDWVWPNDAEYSVLRDMPNSTRAKRQKTEAAAARLMRRRGYFLLSRTAYEQRCQHSAKMKAIHAAIPSTQRSNRAKAMAMASMSAYTPEQRREDMKRRHAATDESGKAEMARKLSVSWESYSPAERSARVAAAVEAMTPEKRRQCLSRHNASITKEQRQINARRGWLKRKGIITT